MAGGITDGSPDREATLLRTSEWRKDMVATHVRYSRLRGLLGIDFVDTLMGWAVGVDGLVYCSSDGGSPGVSASRHNRPAL